MWPVRRVLEPPTRRPFTRKHVKHHHTDELLCAILAAFSLWVLDFAYKPLRVKTVDIPGKGRRQIYWEKWDNAADRFSIYVRGLSDG